MQVSSKSVEKLASYGHLKTSLWPTFSRHFEYLISFQNFFNCLILVITTTTTSVFQQICSFIHKENVSLKMNPTNHWFVFYFDNAYLIRLSDVTKPTIWPLSLQSICKYSNAHNFHIFQPI